MTLLQTQATLQYQSPHCGFIISSRQRKASSWTAPERMVTQKHPLSLSRPLPWKEAALQPHQAPLGLNPSPRSQPQHREQQGSATPALLREAQCWLVLATDALSAHSNVLLVASVPPKPQGILPLNPVRVWPTEIRQKSLGWQCNSSKAIFPAKQVIQRD